MQELTNALESRRGITRRRMVGFLIAAPTLIAAARWNVSEADAALPTSQPADVFDLTDLLTLAAEPTQSLLKVAVNADGTASFALPRAEVGQGITTAITMTIADEIGLPIDKVKVTLADARPELLFNQLTAASNTMHALYEPVRTAAAAAREQMARTAARELGVDESSLTLHDGVFTTADGRTRSFADLAEKAAVTKTKAVTPRLRAKASLKLVGTEQRRVDARAIVTGQKQFAMDLDVPGALPTMICRPPTINGHALEIQNLSTVRKMPGVTDVVVIEHTDLVQGGVAVRAQTFGQCIDAVRRLKVKWAPGTVDGKSDADVLADLKKAEVPLAPALPAGQTIEQLFTFHFRPGDPLETNCAVADVRPDKAEIWSSLKSPGWAKGEIEKALGRPAVVHVAEGGGSFGRHLFCDAAFEAAMASAKIGKPVKLMWHRTDSFRHGRAHPMAISRVRITHVGDQVLAFDQRHTGVQTDYTQGLGDLISANAAKIPGFNFVGYSSALFYLTQNVPYNFGAVVQELTETGDYNTFNTSSVRNVYSPNVSTAVELMVDALAGELGKDRLALRRDFVRDDRLRAVLDRAASAGKWGRSMPAGMAQGIAIRKEYKGASACLVEIDCRPQTVNRKIRHARTGPRVTKVTFVVDVGLPINPLGIKAQIMGGAMDGIAQALGYSLHLKDGHFLEGSWDDAFYTRQWNTPPEVNVIVMPATTGKPGGVGEFGVGTTMAAVACAYGRATGKMPTAFPISHDGPLGFEPFPTVPPIPASPTDGLARAHVKRKRTKKPGTKRRA